MGAGFRTGDSDDEPAAMSAPRSEKKDAVVEGKYKPVLKDMHAVTLSPALVSTGVLSTERMILVECTRWRIRWTCGWRLHPQGL